MKTKKENTKVISRKNLPSKLPFGMTALAYLLLDKFAAPDYVWGIVGTLIAIIWIAVIYAMATNDTVDIFEEKQAPK